MGRGGLRRQLIPCDIKLTESYRTVISIMLFNFVLQCFTDFSEGQV